jgi:NADH:ubiquinone oxidoreductase subunit
MMKFLLQFFTWWNGQTLGTRFFTWRKGEFVGEDQSGNRYYRQRDGSRRWVIYAGVAEPSAVPPDWHGWLHQTVDVPPTEEAYEPRPWQKPHRANMTGTPAAYRPKGSILSDAKRPAATGDYEAWQPE